MNKIILFLSMMLSGNAIAEVIFYDSVKIKDLMIEDQPSSEYFEKLACGNYHCYGIKDKNLYAAGFNSQGQLGTEDKKSRKSWELVIKGNVVDVVPNQFGGCVYLDNGLKYQTGRIEKSYKKHLPKEIEKWTKTKKCLKEKSH